MDHSLMGIAERLERRFQGKSKPEYEALDFLVELEAGYRELINQAGGIYRVTSNIPLVLNQREYSVPLDVRTWEPRPVSIFDGSTRQYLEFVEYVEDLALKPAAESTSGVPTKYSFLDFFTLVLDKKNDGTYTTLTLEYDADAPTTLDLSATLILPLWVEPGLEDYALGRLGLKDPRAVDSSFNNTISRLRAARSRRARSGKGEKIHEYSD